MLEVSADLDTILRKHARISFPLDKTWKRKAVEYCAERLADIQAFRALGAKAIKDPVRRALVTKYLPPPETCDPDDYGFNVWLVNECLGERCMSSESIFLRCAVCTKVRTSRGMSRGPCKCGGMRMHQEPPQMETQKVLARLALGY